MNVQPMMNYVIRHGWRSRGVQVLAALLLITCGGVLAQQPVVPAPAPAKAHAKAVIQIWLWGGPSQLDTFDPKPEAGYDYCGPLNKPISTNVPGMRICELLPMLAQQADKYSLIRSMTHGNNGHETAAYMMQTGHEAGDGLALSDPSAPSCRCSKDTITAIEGDPAVRRADRIARAGSPRKVSWGRAISRSSPAAIPTRSDSRWTAWSRRAFPTSGSATAARCAPLDTLGRRSGRCR